MTNWPIFELKKDSPRFPEKLRQIADCPEQLYCRGNIDLMSKPCFGVVGTRRLTAYGKQATEHIVGELAQHYIIVSGLAIGIDAEAHKTTLAVDGRTIAVLGSGIDDRGITPPENFGLAMEILKHDGLIISEYSSGMPGLKHHFPERNRIVTGLSKGLLVVEADVRSGSLISARLAGEQGRDVYAVPGNIFSTRSKGTNWLLQNGAKPVTCATDILGEPQLSPSMFEEDLSTQNPVEQKILAILDESGSLNADEIVRAAELETHVVVSTLSLLELKGRIKFNKDSTYSL